MSMVNSISNIVDDYEPYNSISAYVENGKLRVTGTSQGALMFKREILSLSSVSFNMQFVSGVSDCFGGMWVFSKDYMNWIQVANLRNVASTAILKNEILGSNTNPNWLEYTTITTSTNFINKDIVNVKMVVDGTNLLFYFNNVYLSTIEWNYDINFALLTHSGTVYFDGLEIIGDVLTDEKIVSMLTAYDSGIMTLLDVNQGDKTRIISSHCYNSLNVYAYDGYTRKLIDIFGVDQSGEYNFDKLDKNKSYYVLDENNTLIYDTDYEGRDTIKGFVEGVTEPSKVILTDKHGNELETQLTTDFEFLNYNTTNLNGNIKIGDTLTPVEYYIGQTRGYISASVVITECLDSDFVIHCFRSSDKQFIGEYPIIDDRYTIDNLNLTQTYDIMLHDKNKVVETQVHSRRTPSIYQ